MALSKPTEPSAAKAVADLDMRLKALERSLFVKGRLIEGVNVGFDSNNAADVLTQTVRVTHGSGRSLQGCVVVAADVGSWSVCVRESNRLNADLCFSSNWEFLQYRRVVNDSTTITFSGLDGEKDYEYYLEGRWITDSAVADNLFLGINGGDTDHFCQLLRVENTTVSAVRDADEIHLAHDFGTGAERHYIRAFIKAALGSRRYVNAYDVARTSTTVASMQHSAGVWDNITDRVTSLDVYSNNAGAIEAGTFFELYRRPRQATVSVWVF